MSSTVLSKANFEQVSKKHSDSYLVLGFDTEFQKVIKPKSGRPTQSNEVLSYQYSCIVADRTNARQEPRWSGLILPKGNRDTDRLTLEEFVLEALKDGIAKNPDLLLPRSIYLVAHFTRADVPAFKEFKDRAGRESLNLDNIRNLFMNVAKDIKLDVPFDKTSDVSLSIKIRDTMALAPTGARKLSDIGDLLDFEKIKVGQTPEEELKIKQNMKSFMENDWDLFQAYAIRDAEVCAEYALKMIRLYDEKTGKFKMPVTLTSIGVDLIEEFWKQKGINPLEIVGKERKTEKYWSKRRNRYETKTKDVSVPKLFWNEDFFTECYHGGRNEQFWFGPGLKSVWYDYDLSSAYPSAMALIGRPNWQGIRQIKDTEELLGGDFIAADLAFANVDFEFPDDVRFPVLPVRTENGLIFPRKGNCSTHISEILLAQSLGCKLKMIEGRFIPSKRHGDWDRKRIPRPNRPFDAFTKYCIEHRRKHDKGTLENLFWKELVNSTYGKTAQGLRERRVYDLRTMDTKRLKPSKITNPAYAAFITAFCRGVLGEIMNRLPEDVSIFSVTTDGFLTTATETQMTEAACGTLSKYYTSARRLLTGKEGVYEIKHMIRQPLGWRTRAQATLSPSEPDDWPSSWGTPKDEERYVLAKGGIKLEKSYSKPAENLEIIRLFFERDPNSKLSLTLGVGIRDMYEEGIDFVDKELERSLSMEFDWKRKPQFVGEVTGATSSGLSYKHLCFSTQPWETVDQFNKTREIWAQYNHESRHCLKTVEDYEAFASFLESRLSTEGPAGAYIAKKDGELKRLRRDLCIAWGLRKAGTHKLKPHAFNRTEIFPDKKLTSQKFAEILNDDLRIPCKKTDVDNAKKKKAFVPHQVPNTETTRAKLKYIKTYLFPELKPELFLAKQSEFNLQYKPLKECFSAGLF